MKKTAVFPVSHIYRKHMYTALYRRRRRSEPGDLCRIQKCEERRRYPDKRRILE